MGTYTFKWAHPASDVYVTGTFDNWGKTEKLEKVGDVFEKEVTLPEASEKIFYKFVVDGNWTTNDSAPKETDHEGNLNNVLLPEDILKQKPEAAIMSSVGPNATTAALASKVPHEKDLPGAFPETPTPAQESKQLSADVEPAQESQQFSVDPLPGMPGYGNAIKLTPGEEVPRAEEITTNTVDSNVTLGKDDYEKSDAFPGGNFVSNGTVVAADLPDSSKGLIPESSLPIPETGNFDATGILSSVGVGATTAGLAAAVPLESKEVAADVPEVVKESQEAAGAAPEASAVASEVADKAKVEEELLEKVPEVPATSGEGVTAATAAAGVPAVVKASQEAAGAAPEASAVPEEVADKAKLESELKAKVPEVPATAAVIAPTTTQGSVPEIVKESQDAAGVAPEASAVPEEIVEKSKVEEELKAKVPEAPVTSEGTAGDAAAFVSNGTANGAITSSAPEVVKESVEASGQSPEALTNSEAVAEKQATEKELLSAVKPETSTGEPAPKLEAPAAPLDSRDVSPHTVPGSRSSAAPATTETKPVAESKPAAPAAAAGSSAPPSPAKTDATEKKKKRTSFFGKLKAKFSDKHKD